MGVLAAVFAIKKVIKLFKQIPAKTTVKDAKTELNKEINYNPLSFTESQYKMWADSIETAIFDIGTDNKAIYSIFVKMNNKADVLSLIVAFGVRPLYDWFVHIGDWNLGQWLHYDMRQSQIDKINTILSNKDINYSF